jgi:hypothetical protein
METHSKRESSKAGLIKPTKHSWTKDFFEPFYNKYKMDNSKQKLPDYSFSIGEEFRGLMEGICKTVVPDSLGTLLDQLAKENYKIKEFLKAKRVHEIVFHDGSKKPLRINVIKFPSQQILISNIVKNTYKFALTLYIKPTKPKGSLSKLLMISKKRILELKRIGITNQLLVDFITKSVFYSSYGLRINTDSKNFLGVKGESVVSIKSKNNGQIEAFQKALNRQ